MDVERLLPLLLAETQRWIEGQRDLHRSHAGPLAQPEQADLSPFFLPQTLERVRVRRVPLIENPAFFAGLGPIPLDFREMAGITYDDTILISEAKVPGPTPTTLLFHELVHVVQYWLLGVPRFARDYVLGWVENDMDYFRIPLEVQAYHLQREFDEGRLDETPLEPRIRSLLGLSI